MAMTPHEQQKKIRNIVIEHDRYIETTEAIGRFHYPVHGGVHSCGCITALIGESRAGKTFATKRYAQRFPAQEGECAVIRPVVYVSMPFEGCGGQRGILEAIAGALNITVTQRATNPWLFSEIISNLIAQKVKLLILDEFDQIFRENDRRLLGFARGLIRKLADLNTFNIICIGLEETYNLLREDSQVVGRGGLPYRVVRSYDWDDGNDRVSFRLLCDSFDKHLGFDIQSELGSLDFAHRLFVASTGNIGLLKVLIEAASHLAINDVTAQSVELRHFAAAYEERKNIGEWFNPFVHDPSECPPKGCNSKLKPGSMKDKFSKTTRRG